MYGYYPTARDIESEPNASSVETDLSVPLAKAGNLCPQRALKSHLAYLVQGAWHRLMRERGGPRK